MRMATTGLPRAIDEGLLGDVEARQRQLADVLAVVHAVEADLGDRLVSPLDRAVELASRRGHPQPPPSYRHDLAFLQRRGGVEDHDVALAFQALEARDRLAGLRRVRVALGRDDHADRGLLGPLDLGLL